MEDAGRAASVSPASRAYGREVGPARPRPACGHQHREGEPGRKDRTISTRSHAFSKAVIARGRRHRRDLHLFETSTGCRTILEGDRGPAANPHTLCAIPLRRGARATICGEESAMIESIEAGAQARLRPPYVAQCLFDVPRSSTTGDAAAGREILEKGPGWFAGHGRHGRRDAVLSVSGRVQTPGCTGPAGITQREPSDEYCVGSRRHELYWYRPAARPVASCPRRGRRTARLPPESTAASAGRAM